MSSNARTSEVAVRAIIEVDETITDLSPFIEAANQLVTDCCGDAGYTDAKLELVERWLAAHFYAVRDPRRAGENVGAGVGEDFQYKVDLNLSVTTYGQQAMLLDTAGGLAALNGRIKRGVGVLTPSMTWLGAEDWDENNIESS